MAQCEWLLRRNCSLTPRQTIKAFVLLCALSFAVGAAFTLAHGTWLVLAFSALEILAVAAAFLQYARHATDREHIALRGNCLLVEQFHAGCMRQTSLDASRLRVTPPRKGGDMIVLESPVARVEVGRFVSDAVRRQVARELQFGLEGGRPA